MITLLCIVLIITTIITINTKFILNIQSTGFDIIIDIIEIIVFILLIIINIIDKNAGWTFICTLLLFWDFRTISKSILKHLNNQ